MKFLLGAKNLTKLRVIYLPRHTATTLLYHQQIIRQKESTSVGRQGSSSFPPSAISTAQSTTID
jgi:hypothetical protein